jgi:tellurite resistance protein TehA-like permease
MTSDTPPARPSRPPVSFTPMREPVDPRRPRPVDAAIALWVLALLGLIASAALVGLKQEGVRATLRQSLGDDHPTRSAGDIRAAVDITMIGAGAIVVIIVLLVIYGSVRIRERLSGSRTTLTTMGVLTAVGAVGFWTVLEPARHEVSPALDILPFAVAGLAVIATVLLFLPPVSRWLAAAPKT